MQAAYLRKSSHSRRWAGFLLAAVACASGVRESNAPEHEPPDTRAQPALGAWSVPRPEFGDWMLVPDAEGPQPSFESSDGRRHFLLRGTRWLERADGSLQRASQVFQEEDVKALELPARLGGGFLFYALSNQGTSLWRARTWAGQLEPLARVEPPASSLRAGFDRLYLESQTHHVIRALDPRDGALLPPAPLPPAAAYGDMAFADAWTGAVLSGIRGPLVTFDAGGTWHPLGVSVQNVELSPRGAISFTTARGVVELDARGRLVRVGERGGDDWFAQAAEAPPYPADALVTNAVEPAPRVPRLGRHPLRAAVLHGWPDTPSTAVVLEREKVGRVRLRDGKVLESAPRSGSHPCRGVPFGDSFAFVCGDSRSKTQVYSYRGGVLRLELSFPRPRSIRSSGNGALVIAGDCRSVSDAARGRTEPGAERPSQPTPGVFCVRQVSGKLLELRLEGDEARSRIVALRSGGVVVVSPPRPGVAGQLSLVRPSGTVRHEIELTAEDDASVRLARSGQWLEPLSQLDDRRVGGWIAGAQAYAGFHLDLDGRVQVGPLQEGLDETSFHGPNALQIAGAATLRESTDYGFEWLVSELAPAVASSEDRRGGLRGCGPVGCVRDGWVRVGFRTEATPVATVEPEPPVGAPRAPPRYSFWSLACSPAVPRVSSRVPIAPRRRPALTRRPPAHRSRGIARAAPPESSSWIAFQGSAPPAREERYFGYDLGQTNEHGAYRAYAWGPGDADWQRAGSWLVRVGDRFSSARPWSTAVTRSPWQAAAQAAQTFGLDPSTGTDWWLRTEAAGRYAVIHVRVRSDNALHLLRPGRAITTLGPRTLQQLGSVAGVHEVAERWYLGATRGAQFHLYEVRNGKAERLRSYPLFGRVPTRLISSVHGDELALWQRSDGSGWYVFPLDAETFEPQSVVHVPQSLLAGAPPACPLDRPGWVVASGVPLTDSGASESNTHLEFRGGAEGLATKRLQARLVLDHDFVCVDALSALLEESPSAALRLEPDSSPPESLPLVVTNPLDDARYSFACSPQ